MSLSDFQPAQLQVVDTTAAARMAALKRYNILDTERDSVFDGIAEIAAALLDAPIAVVNFIADDRQWFKAEIGIGQRELPLNVSICRIALPERGIFVVPDLAYDDRFSSNPLVTVAEGLRFYAGTVLESDGVPIGTVCVLDNKPRPDGISDVQRRGLKALAVQAMAALERSATAGRDRFKFSLSRTLLVLDDANDSMSVTARMLGEYLGVAQVGFGIVDETQEFATVGKEWSDGRMPSMAGRWRLDDFGPDRVALLKAGNTLTIDDIHAEDRGKRAVAEAPYKLAIRSILTVPLVRGGALVAVLFAHHPEARTWQDDEVALVQDCAAQLWNAVVRARTHERLLQSEATARARADELDAIYSAAPVGLCVLDRELRYLRMNERLAEFSGVSAADYIGKTPHDTLPQFDSQGADIMQRVLAGEPVMGAEFVGEMPGRPGAIRTWRANLIPLRGGDDKITGIAVAADEITVEKEAAEKLLRAVERTEIAQAAARAVLYEFDPVTGTSSSSFNFSEITGYPTDTIVSLEWWLSLIHPSDLAMFSETLEAVLKHGSDYSLEYRLLHHDGHWLWVSDRGRAIAIGDGLHRLVGMYVDISEQRQAQQALIESEIRYRAVFEQVGVGVARLSIEGRFLQINDRYCAILGRKREQLVGKPWQEITHPDDLADDIVRRDLLLAGDRASFAFEKRYVGEDNSEIWVNLTLSLVQDAADVPAFFVAMVEDIRARKHTEAALSDSEALFRSLAEALPALIFVADAGGKNIYSNPQFSTYAGLDGDALLGDGWIKALHPDDRERAAQIWARSWRDGLPYETNYRFRAETGDYRTFLVRAIAVRDEYGNIVQWVGQCTDIEEAVAIRNDLAATKAALLTANADLETQVVARTSELVRTNRALQAEIKRREATQAALIQGQKLEALGQLTAGIAHDFNNILAAVASGMDLIAQRAEDEQTKFITGHCRDASFRGAALVKQMLAFARQEVLAPRSVNLARLADDIAPLINQAIPGNVVSIDFPADLPPVLIDPDLLETALLNLAVNARDAMPGGGTLSLTASVSRPDERNHPAEMKAVEAVAMTVRDTGHGMPPEIVQRVTEPFFTTKAKGSGTGLGLSMVHGFVGQSGGAMHIDSRVGVGTTFTLFLPLNTATVDLEPGTAVISDEVPTTGVGALLLVDDDAAVRAISSIQLRDLGYTVVEADGLPAAMTLIEAGEPFDGVVTDVVMPGGDGVTLAAAIRSTRPALPILFMTGRADVKRVEGEQVLHKPFKLVELATAVADVIELPVRERATVAKIALRSRSQCVTEMLDHWSAEKFAGKVPAFAAFDANACFEPHKLAVVIADASQLPMRFEVLSAGKDLEDLLGRPIKENEFDVRGADGFGSAEESYRRAVKTRQPVFDYMKMNFGDGGLERFERLILPYSSEGGLVDRLVSVVVFTKDT